MKASGDKMHKHKILDSFTHLKLKNLNTTELIQLSQEIRQFLLDNVSKTGGIGIQSRGCGTYLGNALCV